MISSPRSRIEPSSGRNTPLTKLKAVVFPAPLGPMRAVMEPASTSKLAPFTAVRPPNAL